MTNIWGNKAPHGGWRQTSTPDKCPHPGCDEPTHAPSPAVCTCPMHLYVPPGQHFHHQCPAHGDIVICGSDVTW